MIRLFLDGVQIEFERQNLNFDFVAADGSPNAVLLNDLKVNIFSLFSDSSGDGMRFLSNWLENQGLKPIPARLIDDVYGLVFEGVIDLSEKTKLSFKRAEIVLKSNIESFADRARAFNLRSLWITTAANAFQPLTVPSVIYIINGVPDYGTQTSLLITGFLLVREAIFIIKAIADGITDPLEQITTALYILTISIAIFEFLTELSDQVFQKPKKYNCIKVIDLLTAACSEIGYNFESTLFDGLPDLCILGPTETPGAKLSLTPLNNPIPNLSILELLEELGQHFNAKTKVYNNTVQFERVDYFYNNVSGFQIEGTNNDPDFAYNIGELYKTFSFEYIKDVFDPNTKEILNDIVTVNFTGDNVEFSQEKKIKSRFALARRNDNPSEVQTAFNSLFDFVASIFGSVPNLGGDRTNYMRLNGDFVGAPRLFFLSDDGRLNENTPITPRKLYENYHRISSPIGSWGKFTIVTGENDQSICGTGNPAQTLESIRQNNAVLSPWGAPAILEESTRSDTTNMFSFRYRVQGWINPISENYGQINTNFLEEIKEGQ